LTRRLTKAQVLEAARNMPKPPAGSMLSEPHTIPCDSQARVRGYTRTWRFGIEQRHKVNIYIRRNLSSLTELPSRVTALKVVQANIDKEKDMEYGIYANFVPGREVGIPNPREKTGFDKASLRELADSLLKDGIRYPLQAWKGEKDGRSVLALVDGERRWRAIGILIDEGKDNGLGKKVPYELVDGDAAAAQVAGIVCNIQRSDLSGYELAGSLVRLQENLKCTQSELADKIHKSKAWVSRTLNAYANACDELKEAWRDGTIPQDTVYDLARIENRDKQREMVAAQLAARGDGKSKKARGKARKVASAAAGKKKRGKEKEKPDRIAVDGIQTILLEIDEDSRYLCGLRDGVGYMTGDVLVTELDKEYNALLKEHAKREADVIKAAAIEAKRLAAEKKAAEAETSKKKKDETATA